MVDKTAFVGSLKRICEDFSESIDATREFLDLLNPKTFFLPDSLLSDDKDGDFAAGFAYATRRFATESGQVGEYPADELAKLKSRFPGRIVEDKIGDTGRASIRFEFDRESDKESFGKVMKRILRTADHGPRLYESVLLLLASLIEVSVSDLLRARYLAIPRALPADKQVAVSSIVDHDSISLLLQDITEQVVEKTMRQSCDKWIESLKDGYGVKVLGAEDFKSQIKEIFLRRNYILHRGGAVNTRFKQESNMIDLPGWIPDGSRIPISSEYAVRAFDFAEVFFTELVYRCCISIDKEDTFWDSWVRSRIENANDSGRFHIACRLNELLELSGLGARPSRNRDNLESSPGCE